MIDISAKRFIEILAGDSPKREEGLNSEIISSPHHISFNNINVVGQAIINNIIIERKVYIKGGVYNIQFEKVELKKWFHITGGKFSAFKVNNLNCIDEGLISIHGGYFTNTLEINGGSYQRGFVISGGEFEHGVRINGGSFNGEFQLSGGVFKRWVEFRNATFNSKIYIHRIDCEYGLQFYKGIYKAIDIWQCPKLKNLYMHGPYQVDELKMRSSENLTVNCSKVSFRLINLADTIFEKSVNLFLHDTPVLLVDLTRFYNFGYLSFSNLLPFDNNTTSTLRIISSNLGRTDFISCDLSQFLIDFESSRITDISILGGRFDNKINNKETKQVRLFNGQLKKVYENKGDQVGAAEAKAADLNAYLESLKFDKKQIFSVNNFEIINLGLNRWSSDHGNNWRKALARILLVSTLTYIIYLSCLGYYPAIPNKQSWQQFCTNLSYYWEFLNPIRKSDYITEQLNMEPNNGSRTVESLSRVILAYFVYQLIQAFRKHSQRG